MKHDLHALLSPASIAIVGASADFAKVNGRPLKHLIQKGYAGKIYPVNPKYPSINGIACYPSVADIPGPVDLAIVAVPAKAVAPVLRELGACGVKSVIVFSSGFAEIGDGGRDLETAITSVAREFGMRLCGPNCLGLINAFERVIATFGQYADGSTPPGPVGFVTQSGAFGTAIAALARRRELGLGYFVNTGNESDVTFAQVMREVLADPRIKVGAGYIEGLRDGAEMIALAESALAAGKPLVIAKVGRSSSGARAAASHTGSLAGADAVFDGVIRQFGIIRARNEEHMLDMVEGFAYCGLPQGAGLGIITQSGGAGVLMADRAEELGLTVPVLETATQRALQQTIPGFGASGNPVDVTGQFLADPALLRESVKIVMADPQVHVGIVWLQLMDAYVDVLIAIFEEIKAQVDKPFVVCWVAASDKALQALRSRGIAVLRGAEPAVDAVAALVRYAAMRKAWQADGKARSGMRTHQLNLPVTSGPVSSLEAAELLRKCGVALAETRLAANAAEAVTCAAALGYPVALKIESPEILHKTEAGGVLLNLADGAAVAAAYTQVVENARRHSPGAKLSGVLVQQMAADGADMVVGLHHDPAYGMVVMVGLGGIHVEVLKDVVFRKVPVTTAEAGSMLDELRAKAILNGVRGSPAVDRAALTRLISSVSQFGVATDGRLAELDLNPVRAGPDGAIAVDWLMICR
ncbi:MAG: acetate--CoA ligase family protein [Betaproteobacteria bacterium]|nr:acetate--CoA ligase family protein [Betaproteobacteria bacterium]